MPRTVPTARDHRSADRPDTWEMVIVHRVFRREFTRLPVLVRGVPAGDVARADVVLAHLLERAHDQAEVFGQDASPAAGEALVVTLTALAAALEEHLGDEEREVLPLVDEHISVPEWEAVGERGRAAIPKDRMLVQLGAILEGCSREEARRFLARLPLPARVAWRLLGRRAYAAERDRVLGR